MRITRRHVLAAMAATTVVGTVAAGATVVRWYDRPVDAPLRALSAEEHAFAQALGEAWMPPGGEPAISGAEARVGDFLDEVVAAMAPQQGKLFRLLLHLLDEETLVTDLSRFQHLPLARRTEVLSGWMNSGWYAQRQAVAAVLALVAFGYTEHPAVSVVVRDLFPCGFGR